MSMKTKRRLSRVLITVLFIIILACCIINMNVGMRTLDLNRSRAMIDGAEISRMRTAEVILGDTTGYNAGEAKEQEIQMASTITAQKDVTGSGLIVISDQATERCHVETIFSVVERQDWEATVVSPTQVRQAKALESVQATVQTEAKAPAKAESAKSAKARKAPAKAEAAMEKTSAEKTEIGAQAMIYGDAELVSGSVKINGKAVDDFVPVNESHAQQFEPVVLALKEDGIAKLEYDISVVNNGDTASVLTVAANAAEKTAAFTQVNCVVGKALSKPREMVIYFIIIVSGLIAVAAVICVMIRLDVIYIESKKAKRARRLERLRNIE